jgi:CRISPR-associated protein Csm3
MHKTRYNAIQLRIQLTPRGPLLIKSGGLSANPSLPDMQFVRTYRAGMGETLYIPGSSLKGVIRGFVEKALRTIGNRQSWQWACPTFPDDDESCAKRLENEKQSWVVYKKSCGACRLFGHTRLRGRLAFTDLFPVDQVATETRYGVAISRLSHAVAQGPFEMEVAVAGTFKGNLVLENYELWQLGVLATALEAMNHGLVKVGFGKNRGFGEVQARVIEAQLEEIQPISDQTRWRGLAAFVGDEERAQYGLTAPDTLEGLPQPNRVENLGFYLRHTYAAENWQAIASQAIEALAGKEATDG